MKDEHPSDAALRAALADESADSAGIEAHLEDCAACRARLEALAGVPEFARDFAPHDDRPGMAARDMLSPSDQAGSL